MLWRKRRSFRHRADLVTWIAAWIAGGMVAKFKGYLLGLVGAAVCALGAGGVDDPHRGRITQTLLPWFALVTGTAWALASAVGVSRPVMAGVLAYLAGTFLFEKIYIALWYTGLQFPWMKDPLRGVWVETGLGLRQHIPGWLWTIGISLAVALTLLWTVESLMRWYGDLLGIPLQGGK